VKPQSKAKWLDEAGASPHPSVMEPDDKPRKTHLDPKEAKLAEALRANLRRRKAAPRQAAPVKPPGEPDAG
jgi:hypothetical protein